MGKKVSPHSLRLGITKTWDSRWFAKKDYRSQFLEDLKIRKYLQEKCKPAGVSRVEIIRSATKVDVNIFAAKPGLIIGRGGEQISILNKDLKSRFGHEFGVSVQEIRKPDADATLIAENVAEQISRRFPYRRVVKASIDRAKDSGVKGIKIIVSGRLNGVDIARKETYNFGTVPLHTLRANIDYATAEANTMYGVIGVKVWVYHGLVFKNQSLNDMLNG